jgi:hypothetical protein
MSLDCPDAFYIRLPAPLRLWQRQAIRLGGIPDVAEKEQKFFILASSPT